MLYANNNYKNQYFDYFQVTVFQGTVLYVILKYFESCLKVKQHL